MMRGFRFKGGDIMPEIEVTLKLSINGIINRVANKKGTISKVDSFLLLDCLRLYNLGKDAFEKGDIETVKKMFDILV